MLIDFTADWCMICLLNEMFALNTAETVKLVDRHNVVPLRADYTDKSPEIKRWLDKFQSISVPLTVIFPGERPNEPIIIRDAFLQSTLLEKLREAVGVSSVQAKRSATVLN